MYLMHRISHENEAAMKLLKEENLLSIGWALLNGEKAERVINNARNMEQWEFRDDFVKLGDEIGNEWLTARRSSYLYRFLRLKKGDKVIIPRPGELYLCEVMEEAYGYKHPEGKDLGFVVPIKMIREKISRHRYIPASLSSKLKYRGTNLKLNENDIEAVENILERHEQDRPVFDFTSTKDQIVEAMHKHLQRLNHQHFEMLVEAYLKSLGANVTERPAPNRKVKANELHADIDVKAIFYNLGICIYVQAKRHEGTSDNAGIKQLLAYQNEGDEEDDFSDLQTFKWYITTGQI